MSKKFMLYIHGEFAGVFHTLESAYQCVGGRYVGEYVIYGPNGDIVVPRGETPR